MELKFDQVCGGAVFVYSEGGRRSAVAAQNWTQAEGARLCQDLQCGRFLSNRTIDSEEPFWNTSFSCQDVQDPKSIWDCETPWLGPQEKRKQLSIHCQGKHLCDFVIVVTICEGLTDSWCFTALFPR